MASKSQVIMPPRVSWGMVLVTSGESAKGAMQPVTRVPSCTARVGVPDR